MESYFNEQKAQLSKMLNEFKTVYDNGANKSVSKKRMTNLPSVDCCPGNYKCANNISTWADRIDNVDNYVSEDTTNNDGPEFTEVI